jgi:hypothetical protein
MLSLDLFNTVYERALNEGAVDDLEARRIHGLNTKMLELMSRAKNANSEMKAALKREYDKIKAERDSYYKIRSTNEAGLPDIADKQAKMAQLNQPGKAGSDAITPQQRVNPNPNKGIIGHAKDWLRGKGGPGKEGPTYESELSEEDGAQQAQQELGAGFGVYQLLLRAWDEKKPYVIVPMPGGGNLSITRNQVFNVLYALKNMNDNTFKKTIANAFGSLDKFMVWSNSIKRYQLPPEKPPQGAPGQMKLFKEVSQKKNSKDIDTPQSTAIQRYLTKVRRAAPNATSDIEAVAKHDLEQQARTNKTINDLKAVNARQDQALKQAMSLDQQQGNEINDVESQLGRLSQKLQLIKTAKPAANQPVASTPTAPATTPATTLSKTDTAQATQPTREPTEIPQPIYIDQPENLSLKDQEIYSKVKDLETELKSKIDAMASWNKVAQKDDESRNELEMLRKDMERTKRELNHKIKQLKKSGTVSAEPRQAGLDLAPAKQRFNPVASLRQNLGRTLGQAPARELPVPNEPELNILSQADFDRLSPDLERRPVEVEEGQMSELDAMRQDLELMTDRQFSVAYGMSKAAFKQQYRTLLNPAPQQSTPVIDEHGGGIGPKQHWQDLMQENKLSVGDPVVVTGPNEYEGKTGEIYDFSPSGSFVIVDLYNHGKHSMHLSDIAYNEYADREQDDEDDWYDEGVSETVTDPRAGMAKIYRKLAPKIERYKDSFLAGQLYDELENYAELHGAEAEFRRMMNGARNRAHMEYDTNPGGFHNWFWFLPFEDNDIAEAIDEKGALKSAQAAAKFMLRNLDDRDALKDYSMHFWSPEKFYQGATMAMRGAGHNEIVRHITQDRPAQFESGVAEGYERGSKVQHPKYGAGQVYKVYPNGMISVNFPEYLAPMSKQPGVTGNFMPGDGDYQSLKSGMAEGWSDAMVSQRTGQPRTPYSVYINGRKWKDFENDDHAQAVANKLRAKFKAEGRDPSVITIAPTDYDQPIKEEQDTSAVERAIIHRIMVDDKLRNMAMDIGTDKVFQAVEEVAYNVGDVDEIGSSDVSGWVNQVKQILGVPKELDEKWSQKYKSSINCANPKGFSQRAHCASKKK